MISLKSRRHQRYSRLESTRFENSCKTVESDHTKHNATKEEAKCKEEHTHKGEAGGNSSRSSNQMQHTTEQLANMMRLKTLTIGAFLETPTTSRKDAIALGGDHEMGSNSDMGSNCGRKTGVPLSDSVESNFAKIAGPMTMAMRDYSPLDDRMKSVHCPQYCPHVGSSKPAPPSSVIRRNAVCEMIPQDRKRLKSALKLFVCNENLREFVLI